MIQGRDAGVWDAHRDMDVTLQPGMRGQISLRNLGSGGAFTLGEGGWSRGDAIPDVL